MKKNTFNMSSKCSILKNLPYFFVDYDFYPMELLKNNIIFHRFEKKIF